MTRDRVRDAESLKTPKLGLDSDANYWKITIHSRTEKGLERIRIGWD